MVNGTPDSVEKLLALRPIHEARRLLRDHLAAATEYTPQEATRIADTLLEATLALSRAKLLTATYPIPANSLSELAALTQRVVEGEPIQYVLGHVLFAGLLLEVDRRVLIPRPETEELALTVRKECGRDGLRLVDACCGSGCLLLAIGHGWEKPLLTGLEVSHEALEVATNNAQRLGVKAQLLPLDLLSPVAQQWANENKGQYDVVVSNPPYIPASRQASLPKLVEQWEPHLALFVPDDDPLCFFRAISQLALQVLTPNGRLYFECDTDFVTSVAKMMREAGWGHVETRRDLFGRHRFVIAHRRGTR